MTDSKRPLSPHLQVYRLPLTAFVSITHRMTGAALIAGWIFIILSLVPVVLSTPGFSVMQQWLGYLFIKLVLAAFLFALFLHWCHGVRHLFMDIGKSLQKQTMDRYAVIEIGLSLAMTLVASYYLWAE